MLTRVLYVAAALCVAVIMAAGWAHLLALPNKLPMTGEHYLVAQQAYRGWALLGIVELAALALTAALAWRLREAADPAEFLLALIAVASILSGLAIFFMFTYPANQATGNWTTLPQGWQSLRERWEYSHAAGAVLYFIALASLLAGLARTKS